MSLISAIRSSDEVRLVDHAAGVTAADADEETLVQPGELARRGLDLRGGAKGVLARIDILAAAETFENLRAAVAHAPRLHVEQGTAVGLQRVADVAESRAIRQHDLPIHAGTRQELSVQLGSGERATGEGDDAAAASARWRCSTSS